VLLTFRHECQSQSPVARTDSVKQSTTRREEFYLRLKHCRATQALEGEISRPGLQVPREEPRAPQKPEPPPDFLYAEDRELVEICTVWSLSDALQLQTLLDRAAIPVFMAPPSKLLRWRQ
jgi:hypothetical protein